jgi:hypothetical protein
LKRNKFLWLGELFLLAGLLILFLAGCEKTGPIGPSGTATCGLCHNDNTEILSRVAQWENSIHASGATVEHGNSTSCAMCHTNEGFVEYLETNSVATEFDNPTPIGCFTCHAPHTTGTFALRTNAPYTLQNGDIFGHGDGNLCANCHHSRQNVTTYVAGDSVQLTTRFGAHHGPQGDMLAGTGGYEYSGYTYTSSYHTTGVTEGCVTCHMAPSSVNTLGEHSWNMVDPTDSTENIAACMFSGCHGSNLANFDFDGTQTEVDNLLEELKTLLVAGNLVNSSGTPKARWVHSADSAGAVYNFQFVTEDRSKGVHNKNYTIQLLQSSIDYLSL